MANGATHKAAAMSCLETLSMDTDRHDLAGISISTISGYYLGRLPEMLEPANSPSHRQFFHSWVMGGLIVYGGYKACRWQPESWPEKALMLLLVAGSIDYISPLARDTVTLKGLLLM